MTWAITPAWRSNTSGRKRRGREREDIMAADLAGVRSQLSELKWRLMGSTKNFFFFFLRPAGTNSRRPLQRYLLLRRSLLCWKMTAEGHSECSHELISGNTLLTANLFQTHAGNHTGGDRLRQRLKRPEARLQTARQHRCWSAWTMMSSRGKHQDKENRSRIIYSICCLCWIQSSVLSSTSDLVCEQAFCASYNRVFSVLQVKKKMAEIY